MFGNAFQGGERSAESIQPVCEAGRSTSWEVLPNIYFALHLNQPQVTIFMFSNVIESVRNGKLPEFAGLRKKFDLALVKKMGVISLPYHFWQGDPKINPPASQLLWVAILLEDVDAAATVVGIIQKELDEQSMASGAKNDHAARQLELQDRIILMLDDLLAMAPSSKFRKIISAKCRTLETVCSFE
jgi:hypothetical protein